MSVSDAPPGVLFEAARQAQLLLILGVYSLGVLVALASLPVVPLLAYAASGYERYIP